MKFPFRIAGALLAAAALPASASLVTMHTRASTANGATGSTDAANGAYYRDTVNAALAVAPTSGYCDTTVASFSNLNNQGACGGSASNLAYAFTVDFGISAAQGADFSFRMGADFGKGGSVYLDGLLLGVRTSDQWWGGNWASATFQSLDLVLNEGNHRLYFYGLEACCDGGQQAEYRIGQQGIWTVFSSSDSLPVRLSSTQAVRVPEPSSLALLLAVAMGLGSVHLLRMRQAGRS